MLACIRVSVCVSEYVRACVCEQCYCACAHGCVCKRVCNDVHACICVFRAEGASPNWQYRGRAMVDAQAASATFTLRHALPLWLIL